LHTSSNWLPYKLFFFLWCLHPFSVAITKYRDRWFIKFRSLFGSYFWRLKSQSTALHLFSICLGISHCNIRWLKTLNGKAQKAY
jgi:hypothetical protein